MTVWMPMVAAASNTTSGAGVGIEPSGVHSSSLSSGAWPVGEARPLASKAARISAGRSTNANASTLRRPRAASLSSEPDMSAENSDASVYSCTEASGREVVIGVLLQIVVEGRRGRAATLTSMWRLR